MDARLHSWHLDSRIAGRDDYLPDVQNLTDSLSRHIASYRDASLDPEFVEETKKRIADCLVAMMSGSTLLPGRVARNYAADRGGPGASTVAGSAKQTNSEMAAFANGIAAHADN